MATKNEDILFKDVSEEEVDTLLKRLKIKSKKKKLNPTEIRYIDATVLIADIIIELDDMILIIEFQSSYVDKNDKNRFLAYYSVVNLKKKTNKKVKLIVVSTVEEAKRIIHKIDDDIIFKFDIYSMKDEDGDEVINNIKTKLQNNESLSSSELLDLALVPLMGSENTKEEQVEESVDLILSIDLEKYEVRNLVKSIAYLLADKILEDGEKKTVICDALGGKMSAIYDYGKRKKKEGIKEGMEEGKKEGKKEENENIAIKMIKDNKPDEEILKYINIKPKELKELKDKLKK